MLVACCLLNRTRGDAARPVLVSLFERYPTPEAMALARPVDLARRLQRLGLHRQRARTLVALSRAWAGGERDLAKLPGVGRYARDSFAIFQEGRRDVEPEDRVLRAYLAGGR
jgi:endonuclease III